MTLFDEHGSFTNTAMGDALDEAGVEREETPQEAAERIWNEAGVRHGKRGYPITHDPVEIMRRFSDWALPASPERILGVLSRSKWDWAVREFLARGPRTPGGWRHGDSFRQAMKKIETKGQTEKRRGRYERGFDLAPSDAHSVAAKRHKDRKRRGVKVVQAEVNVMTGAINLIDKDFGPFAGIRINNNPLADVTTVEALEYCADKTTDVQFVRALCSLIPDPRKPIGEQWSVGMIQEAQEIATRANAA